MKTCLDQQSMLVQYPDDGPVYLIFFLQVALHFFLARAIFTVSSIWSNVLNHARMCQVETFSIVGHYQIFKNFILWMQAYLSSEEFRQKFEMTKSDFYKLPKWKQDKLKKALELFWFSHVQVPLQIPPTGMQPLEQECSRICMLSLSQLIVLPDLATTSKFCSLCCYFCR